jgi:HSP20 family molecular chaperone IbpA
MPALGKTEQGLITVKNPQNVMFSRALRLLSEVDDMRRLDFGLGAAGVWEPALDLIETRTEIRAYVALPGVDTSTIDVRAEGGTLVIRGERPRPAEWASAALLRLELPWGPFERHVRVPNGCEMISREVVRGHLVIRLTKPQEDASG